MALFGRGYDSDYDQAYRSSNAPWRSSWNRSGDWLEPGYGGEYQNRNWSRPRAWGGSYPYDIRSGYGGDYYRQAGYDRDFKSRWQTDYGDPYGDRVQQTPIRVIRGEGGGYDRGLFSGGYDRNYGRDRSDTGYPFGYMPYGRRAGYDVGYGGRGGNAPRNPGWYGRYDRERY